MGTSGDYSNKDWVIHNQAELLKYWNSKLVKSKPVLEEPKTPVRYTVDPSSLSITDSVSGQRFVLDDITHKGQKYSKSELVSMPEARRRELLSHVAMYFENSGVDLTDAKVAHGKEHYIEVERGPGKNPGKHVYPVSHEIPNELAKFLHKNRTSYHEWEEINKIMNELALKALGMGGSGGVDSGGPVDRKGKGPANDWDTALTDDLDSSDSLTSTDDDSSSESVRSAPPLERDLFGIVLRKKGSAGPSGSGEAAGETSVVAQPNPDFASAAASEVAADRASDVGSGLVVDLEEETDSNALHALRLQQQTRNAASETGGASTSAAAVADSDDDSSDASSASSTSSAPGSSATGVGGDDSDSDASLLFSLLNPPPPTPALPAFNSLSSANHAALAENLEERAILPAVGDLTPTTLVGISDEISRAGTPEQQAQLALSMAAAISSPPDAVPAETQVAFWNSVPWRVLDHVMTELQARTAEVPYAASISQSLYSHGSDAITQAAKQKQPELDRLARRDTEKARERSIREKATMEPEIWKAHVLKKLRDAVIGIPEDYEPKLIRNRVTLHNHLRPLLNHDDSHPTSSPFYPTDLSDKNILMDILFTMYTTQLDRNAFRLANDAKNVNRGAEFWTAIDEVKDDPRSQLLLRKAAELLRAYSAKYGGEAPAITNHDPFYPQRVAANTVHKSEPVLQLANALWPEDDPEEGRVRRALSDLYHLGRTVELATGKLGLGRYKYACAKGGDRLMILERKSRFRRAGGVGTSDAGKRAARAVIKLLRQALDEGITSVPITRATIGMPPTDEPEEVDLGQLFYGTVFNSSAEWWRGVMRHDDAIAADFRKIWIATTYGKWLRDNAKLAKAIPPAVRRAMLESPQGGALPPDAATRMLGNAFESLNKAGRWVTMLDEGEDPLDLLKSIGEVDTPVVLVEATGSREAVTKTRGEIVESLDGDHIFSGVLQPLAAARGEEMDEVFMPTLKAVIKRYEESEVRTQMLAALKKPDGSAKSVATIDWQVIEDGFAGLGDPPPLAVDDDNADDA